jgi:hypothetical protein
VLIRTAGFSRLRLAPSPSIAYMASGFQPTMTWSCVCVFGEVRVCVRVRACVRVCAVHAGWSVPSGVGAGNSPAPPLQSDVCVVHIKRLTLLSPSLRRLDTVS